VGSYDGVVVFKDGVGDLRVEVGLFDFMNRKMGFDLDGDGNEVVVFEKENGFDDLGVFCFNWRNLKTDGFSKRVASAPREAAIEVVFVVSNEGVLVEDFVRERAVERGGPQRVENEVAKRTAKANTESGGTAGWDGEYDGLRVGFKDVEKAVLFSLEFDFVWVCGFHGWVFYKVCQR